RRSIEEPSRRGVRVGSSFDLGRFGPVTLRELREIVEREYIALRLEETGWNVTRTADVLGIERTNLHKKIKQLGLQKRAGARDER
ncbi:MAG: hypothetical protein HC923_06745, partial [Myxococcales bacterium]|nr:hypothetical protein [Myxococcales bacterium]